MNSEISSMTPLYPEQAEELHDLALSVIQKSATLGSRQHPVALHTLRELLRIINSYYSNLIEGHNTHPYDIVRAMQNKYAAQPAKRNLQIESVAHIAVQKSMETRLREDSGVNMAGQEFLCYLHREFYEQLPDEFLIVTDPDTGRESRVVPGQLRGEQVKVGRHVPPESGALQAFLERFAEFYAVDRHHGAGKLVAAAASHHRFMWIHPFLDGNGRVARLFVEAQFHRIPVDGYGLWSVSRGFARRNADYKAALTWADAPRRNDLDGRGSLSNEGLIKFCRFFLEVCLDQVEYMSDLLKLEELIQRVQHYVFLRNRRLTMGSPYDKNPLREESAGMLQHVLIHGISSRGDAIRASGLKERTGRVLLGQLLTEGLLLSDTPKGEIRIGFPIHAAGYYFPDLYPALGR
ncbi:Fic family protein [bacterium]|nr:Fic family protein [bacterium]